MADESTSMLIWRQTVLEFRQLLRNYGAFRDVQLWGLSGDDPSALISYGVHTSIAQPQNAAFSPPILEETEISKSPRIGGFRGQDNRRHKSENLRVQGSQHGGRIAYVYIQALVQKHGNQHLDTPRNYSIPVDED